MRGSCSSASSRAIGGPCRASPSSARRARCSTRRSTRWGSTRGKVYVTNAVKHFKFVPRGKRRIHQKPNAGESSGLPVLARSRDGAGQARNRSSHWARPRRKRSWARPRPCRDCAATPIALADGTTLFVTVHPSYLLAHSRPRKGRCRARARSCRSRIGRPIAENAIGPALPLDSTPAAALISAAPTGDPGPPRILARRLIWGGVAQLVRAAES